MKASKFRSSGSERCWEKDGHRYDSLYYRYQMNGGELTRNRLYQLLDLADQANAYANDVHDLDYSAVDIIDQGDAANHVNVKNNYAYDEIGNLVKDSLEQIQVSIGRCRVR